MTAGKHKHNWIPIQCQTSEKELFGGIITNEVIVGIIWVCKTCGKIETTKEGEVPK